MNESEKFAPLTKEDLDSKSEPLHYKGWFRIAIARQALQGLLNTLKKRKNSLSNKYSLVRFGDERSRISGKIEEVEANISLIELWMGAILENE